jgi:hypothetical protein
MVLFVFVRISNVTDPSSLGVKPTMQSLVKSAGAPQVFFFCVIGDAVPCWNATFEALMFPSRLAEYVIFQVR